MRHPLNFDTMITEGADRWREVGSALDAAENLVADAANDPVMLIRQAGTTLAFVRITQEKLQKYLRERFGVELDDSPARPRIHVVDEERAHPRTLAEVTHGLDVVVTLMTYNAAWWAMKHAIKQGTLACLANDVVARWWWWKEYRVARPVLPPDYAAAAAVRAFLYAMRNAPILYAPFARHIGGVPREPRLEEAAAGLLAAWVR